MKKTCLLTVLLFTFGTVHAQSYEDRLLEAKTMRDNNKWTEAINKYEGLLKERPEDREIRKQLALAYAFKHDFKKSFSLYEDLLEDEPGDWGLRLEYAKILTWGERHRKALREFREVLKKDPSNKEALLYQAKVTAWNRENKKSIDLYETYLSKRGDEEEAYEGLAQVLSWEEQYAKAEKTYKDGLKKHPESRLLSRSLLNFYLGRNDMKRANQLLKDHPYLEKLYRKNISRIHASTEYRKDENNFNQSNELFTHHMWGRGGETPYYWNLTIGRGSYQQPGRAHLNEWMFLGGLEKKAGDFYLKLSGGADVFDDIPANGIFGIDLSYLAAPKMRWKFGAWSSLFKANAETLSNSVRMFRYGPELSWEFLRDTYFYGFYKRGDLNDGNHEDQYLLKLERKLPYHFFLSGAYFNWSYDEPTNLGYFAPESFKVYTLALGWEGRIYRSLSGRFLAAQGQQEVPEEKNNAFEYEAKLTYNLFKQYDLSVFYQAANVRNNLTRDERFKTQTIMLQLQYAF